MVIGKFSLYMLGILARPKRIPHVPDINSGHNRNEHPGPQASPGHSMGGEVLTHRMQAKA